MGAGEAALAPWVGWVVLAGFSALWLWLGRRWGRGVRSFSDRALAGRSVGLALATATAMATWVTSNTTMAAPQLAYQIGVWGMLGYALGAAGLVLFAPIAARVRKLMPGGYTSGDFIRARYGRGTWAVFLVISLAYALGWLVSMGMAGGVLLSALTGVDYHVGMLVITAVCVGYTLLGGLRAVIGTDFIQCVLILVGLVVVAVAVYTQVGLDVIHAELGERRPALLDLLMPAALIFLANNALFGLGEVFHSNVWWSRAFAFREGVGMRAFVIAGVAWLPVPLVAGSIALAAPALDLNVPALDMVGPAVVGRLLGSGGALLILVVVFASLASSLDSLLAATSDLLVEDVYRGLLRPDADEAAVRRAGHAIVIGLGVLCVLLCWPRLTTLAELIQLTGALVASTIWPIVAGVYWRTTNRRGAAVAMVAGSLSGLVAYFTIGFYAAALVGAAASMIVVVGSMLAWPEPFEWGALRGLRAPAGADEGGAT